MLDSACARVGVDLLGGNPTYSTDRERSAKLNAPVSPALDRERTRANAYARSIEPRADKKSRVAKPDGRVRAAKLAGNTDERASDSTGMTKRREAEVQPGERQWRYRMTLSRANRIAALGQMSASIAHEINQPVAAVATNAQAALHFLEGPNPDLAEIREALIRIARLATRVVDIVGRTRALVQKAPPRKDDFEINEAIGEIIALSQGDLLEHAVSVHTHFAAGLPLVRADRIQLQQVILNLITNAMQAMSGVPEARRELRIITAQSNAGEIVVTVQDSGPGLDVQNPDRLFDPFYSTKPRGLGIGLSICRSIVEAHKGRLWASQTQPHGAAFRFTLPVGTGGASPN